MKKDKKSISGIFILIIICSMSCISVGLTNSYSTDFDGEIGLVHSGIIGKAKTCIQFDSRLDSSYTFKNTLSQLYHELTDNFNYYKDQIVQGSSDYDDEGFFVKCDHYWDPIAFEGFFGLPLGAPYHAKQYFEEAINLYSTNKFDAYYKLGFAVHLLQDLTVPHHARNEAFDTHIFTYTIPGSDWPIDYNIHYHGEYESLCSNVLNYLNLNWQNPSAEEHYIPPFSSTNDYDSKYKISIEDWIHCAALEAYSYYPSIHDNDVTVDLDTGDIIEYPIEWNNAAEILVKQAVQMTAGFLLYFWQIVNDLDLDGDQVGGMQEYLHNTNYLSADTDGDTLSDYEEIYTFNTNPNVPEMNLINFDYFFPYESSTRIASVYDEEYIHFTYIPSTQVSTYSIESYMFNPIVINPLLVFNQPHYENFRIEIEVDWEINSKRPIWHSLMEVGNIAFTNIPIPFDLEDLIESSTFTRFASVGTRDSWSSSSGQFWSYGNGVWRYSDTYNDMALIDNNVKYFIQKIGSTLECKISNGNTIYFEETYNMVSGSVNTVLLWFKHSDNYFYGNSIFDINSIRGAFWE